MRIRIWIIILMIAISVSGCSRSCQRHEDIAVQTVFDGHQDQTVQIVVSTTPLEPKESTLQAIQSFFKESLGLETEISRVDFGVSSISDMTEQALFDAAKPILKQATSPMLVIITVEHVDDFGGYGWCQGGETTYKDGRSYPVAVVTLIRKDFLAKSFESILLKHEVGHWVGVPARDCHLYKDHSHCTNLRCLMMSGPGSNAPRWLCGVGLSAALGPPGFCDDCKEELAAMKALR